MLSVSKRFPLHEPGKYMVIGRNVGSFPQLLPHTEEEQIMDKISVLSDSLIDLLTTPRGTS